MNKSQYKYFLKCDSLKDSVKVLGNNKSKSLELLSVKLPGIQTLGEARMQGRRTGAVSEVGGVVIEIPLVKSIPALFELLRKGTSIPKIIIEANTMHEEKSSGTSVLKPLYSLTIRNARICYGSMLITAIHDLLPSEYTIGYFIIKGDEYNLDQYEYEPDSSNKKGKSGINISSIKEASKRG